MRDKPDITLQDADVLFSIDIQNREIRLVVEEVRVNAVLDRTRLKVVERRWDGAYQTVKDVVRYYATDADSTADAWEDLNDTIRRTLSAEVHLSRHVKHRQA